MDELKEIVKKEYSENDKTLCFESTPVMKVIILSILSGGFYHIILTYSWWKTLKQNFGYKVSPFWRGFFSIFTNIKLFPIFQKYFKSLNIPGIGFCGIFFGIIYLILAWIDNKIQIKALRLDLKDQLSPELSIFINIVSFILILILTCILAFIQKKINKTNEMYFQEAPKNDWKTSNAIWIIILTFISAMELFLDVYLLLKSA